MEKEQYRRLALQINGLLTERNYLASRLGQIMNGRRDIYAVAGYPPALSFADYYGAYRRQDLARRIVTAKPDETWRLPPIVLDGVDEETAKDDTPFVQAVRALVAGAEPGNIENKFGLWHVLHRLDRVSGIGRYGVLLLGLRSSSQLDQPIQLNEAKSERDLLYLSVFDEAHAEIAQFDTDPSSPRFGLPFYYNLTTTDGKFGGTRTTLVHWSRCLHVAESLDSDDVYGTPRLEACWNRLVDILKITAASGEAAWKLSDPGYNIKADEGRRLPTEPEQIEALEAQIEDFVNGFTRWLMLEGMTIDALPGNVQDLSDLVKINIALIAAAINMPQRILIGSERGDLSSTQDERNWVTQIETRQTNYVTPGIIKPLLSRLIYAGVVPPPATGNIIVKWPNLLESDRAAEAQTAKTAAEALAIVRAQVEPSVFVETYLPELPATAVSESPTNGGNVAEEEVIAANAAPFWRFDGGHWHFNYS